MTTKNPLFIPKGFEKTKKNYREIYKILKIGREHIRIIEYYTKTNNQLTRVNIWGVCDESNKDNYFAIDEEIDFKKGERLKKKIGKRYSSFGNIEILVL